MCRERSVLIFNRGWVEEPMYSSTIIIKPNCWLNSSLLWLLLFLRERKKKIQRERKRQGGKAESSQCSCNPFSEFNPQYIAHDSSFRLCFPSELPEDLLKHQLLVSNHNSNLVGMRRSQEQIPGDD